MPTPADTVRLQSAFPEVAVLRKGDLKTANQPGRDLMSKFRIVFYPGCDIYRDAFQRVYSDYPTPARVRAMIPFQSVWSAWQSYNEAYQNGRLILRADDSRVLFYKNPMTGKVEIRDGQPEPGVEPMDYHPGMVIRYQGQGGKTFELPTRSVGRLRLFLPEMGRMVSVTLKTTSYYDKLNIEQQLAAIQSMAWLNRGIAGGIPFYVFRREQEITWNKKDGGCAQIKKWLINIEIDPAWVEAAVSRMSDFALTGAQAAGLLQPGPIAGHVDPEQDDDEDIIDHDDIPTPHVPQVQPPAAVTPSPAPAPQTEAPANRWARPMAPATLKDALAIKAERRKGQTPNQKQIGLVATMLEKCFAGQDGADKIRHTVLGYLTGHESLKDMPGDQVLALLDWLAPAKDSGGDYQPDKMAVREATSVWPAALEAAGQKTLL